MRSPATAATQGLLELDRREPPDIELAYFGVTPELTGQGAGRWLMHQAMTLAWRHRPRRFWVHTCTLDHPGALPFYIRSGFRALPPCRRGRRRPAPDRPGPARLRALAAADRRRAAHEAALAPARPRARSPPAAGCSRPINRPSSRPASKAAPTASTPTTSRCCGRSTIWASRPSSAASTGSRPRSTSTPPHPRPPGSRSWSTPPASTAGSPPSTTRCAARAGSTPRPIRRPCSARPRSRSPARRPAGSRATSPSTASPGPVTLDVTFNGGANNLLTGRYTLGFDATGTIKRSEFGITNLVPAVGDEVSSRSTPSSGDSDAETARQSAVPRRVIVSIRHGQCCGT